MENLLKKRNTPEGSKISQNSCNLSKKKTSVQMFSQIFFQDIFLQNTSRRMPLEESLEEPLEESP